MSMDNPPLGTYCTVSNYEISLFQHFVQVESVVLKKQNELPGGIGEKLDSKRV